MPRKSTSSQKPASSDKLPGYRIELEVTEGLESIALQELIETFPERLVKSPVTLKGAVQAQYDGNLGGLLSLNTINAAYLLQTFDVPRPKALLGHQQFTALTEQINTVRGLSFRDAYQTVHIGAAGSHTTVMRRLLDDIAQSQNLIPDTREGDLLVRLRPALRGEGWDALVRLSPRPSATRDWRVVNVRGALDAAVAHAMVYLSNPTEDDVVFNLASGSGTLAIERARYGAVSRILACDINAEASSAATQNIAAAGLTDAIELHDWDATDVPMSPGTVDVFLTDLPFGSAVGSHRENITLYPALLKEAARLGKRGARYVIITHEVRLFEAVLRDQDKWQTDAAIRIPLSGLHPRIYVLSRA